MGALLQVPGQVLGYKMEITPLKKKHTHTQLNYNDNNFLSMKGQTYIFLKGFFKIYIYRKLLNLQNR